MFLNGLEAIVNPSNAKELKAFLVFFQSRIDLDLFFETEIVTPSNIILHIAR